MTVNGRCPFLVIHKGAKISSLEATLSSLIIVLDDGAERAVC